MIRMGLASVFAQQPRRALDLVRAPSPRPRSGRCRVARVPQPRDGASDRVQVVGSEHLHELVDGPAKASRQQCSQAGRARLVPSRVVVASASVVLGLDVHDAPELAVEVQQRAREIEEPFALRCRQSVEVVAEV